MKTNILTVAIAGGLVVTGSGLHQAKAASFANPADAARADIGQAYSWGNNDCSGLTKRVFAQFGVTLPHNSAAQSHYGTPVSASNLQPGDLVFFNTSGSGISHVGIYVGNNRMISSENSAVGVRETQIFGGGASSYWQPRFVTARRIVTSGSAAGTQTQSQSAATNNQSSSTTTSEQPASSQNSSATSSESQSSNQNSSATSNESQSSNQNSNATSSEQTADNQPAVVASANQPAASQAQSSASQAASTKVQTVSSSPSHAVNHGVYIVTAGDSLWAIANHTAGLTVTKIQKLNHLSGTLIHPGQKLILKTPVEKYTIKSGDTLWKIAKDHGTTVKQLISDNQLTSDLIFPNRVLNMPQQ